MAPCTHPRDPSIQPSGAYLVAGIVVDKYVIEGTTFEMYDVGGQRNERKKWIHCFDNVTAVIYVAALSEYNQGMFEDANTNRCVARRAAVVWLVFVVVRSRRCRVLFPVSLCIPQLLKRVLLSTLQENSAPLVLPIRWILSLLAHLSFLSGLFFHFFGFLKFRR